MKGCKHPGMRDFGVPTVILNGITLQYERNLMKTLPVFTTESGRGQAANNVVFLHRLPSRALAGCCSEFRPWHWTGMVFGSVRSKATQLRTRHQPPTSQREAELHLALHMVGGGKKGRGFLSLVS